MKTNRLAQEKSPYLLQHARNPVDWFPWGDEAFERARSESKPIFLSVGYSTCHWCHVMEHESFENDGIARLLNAYYVSIKVDREERPDIDHVYMTFVQATTGGGGWPMSVFLTPDLAPFFGGTYFPPEPRYGSPGFRQVLMGIAREWQQDPMSIITSAGRVMGALQSIGQGTGGGTAVGPGALQDGFRYFSSTYDRQYGGFEGAPKFPCPVVFNFLLRYGLREGALEPIAMTQDTLMKMARGGIHDHLGGGFHRYSVDETWHVPHFEKMLYDQAQLLAAYIETWQVTGEAELLEVASDVVRYVLRDLRSPLGGFFSAEDADSPRPELPSEKAEGAFYVWGDMEVRSLLEARPHALFSRYYDVRPEGNVSMDPHGEFVEKNILHVVAEPAAVAAALALPEPEVQGALARARQVLLEQRNRRPWPHLDDKVLTAWNGMFIAALAAAAEATDTAAWLQAAVEAGTFLWDTMRDAGSGELRRRYRDGGIGIEGVLDDYVHSVKACMALYEATFDTRWLERAVALQEKQDELFWGEDGAYFDTTGRDKSVLLRSRSDYDGAEPSPNSVAALNLVRLSQYTDRAAWYAKAEDIVKTLGGRTPAAIPNLLVAAEFLLSSPTHLVVAGEAEGNDTQALLRVIRRRLLPHRILMLVDGGVHQARLAAWLPYLAAVGRQDGKATVYLCDNRSCRQPTTDPAALETLLGDTPHS